MLAQLVRKAKVANLVMVVLLELKANLVIKDPADHPAHLDQLENPVQKALLVKLVKSFLANLAQLVHPALLANLVHLVQLPSPAKLAKTDLKDHPVQVANLALLAAPAKLAHLEKSALLANLEHLAPAITAHLLVWLLVIRPNDPQDSKNFEIPCFIFCLFSFRNVPYLKC